MSLTLGELYINNTRIGTCKEVEINYKSSPSYANLGDVTPRTFSSDKTVRLDLKMEDFYLDVLTSAFVPREKVYCMDTKSTSSISSSYTQPISNTIPYLQKIATPSQWITTTTVATASKEPEMEKTCPNCDGETRVMHEEWVKVLEWLEQVSSKYDIKYIYDELLFRLAQADKGEYFYLDPCRKEGGILLPSVPFYIECEECQGTGTILTEYGKNVIAAIENESLRKFKELSKRITGK